MKTYELTYKRGDEELTYRTPSLQSALDMADRCGAAELFLTVEDGECLFKNDEGKCVVDGDDTEYCVEGPCPYDTPRAGLLRTFCEGMAFCGIGAAAAMAVGAFLKAVGV